MVGGRGPASLAPVVSVVSLVSVVSVVRVRGEGTAGAHGRRYERRQGLGLGLESG